MLCGALALAITAVADADSIPYPNPGTYNAQTYTFSAISTGDVIAYFAGTDAAFDERLGLLINGVQTSAGFGLDNHTSTIGQSFDLGHANAGDTLVFDVKVVSPPLGIIYSDPSLNVPYDEAGETIGHNHVYSTAYTATSPIFPGVPPGLYVGFEDEQFPFSDFSYADETFVFTNARIGAVPEPSSFALAVLSTSAGVIVWGLWRKRKQAV
jgi:hypothetical protein